MKKLKLLISLFLVVLVIGSSMNCFAASIPVPDFPDFTSDATITWWYWGGGADELIAEFNKEYPNIHINHPMIGSGAAEYTKLQTAIQAGSGAPDVVQIEFQELPQFISTGGLIDISQYVNQYESYFQSSAWQQCSQGDKVYAIPQDTGPLAYFFRPEILSQYGLTPPKTYDDLAKDAAKLHNTNPDMYYTFLPVNEGAFLTALLWQGGSRLFENKSGTWYVNINSDNSKKIMNYWGDLIKQGYVKAANDFTPEWGADIGSGKYAAMIGCTWSPLYEIAPYIKPETKNWNVADVPQWNSSEFINACWGGSTFAVTKQSKNPEAAALFAAWINCSEYAVVSDVTPGGRNLFAADKYVEQLDEFKQPDPYLANQVTNEIWSKAVKAVNTDWEWSPWTDYVYKQMATEFTKASENKQTWDQALDNVQANTIAFGKSMGDKVEAVDQTKVDQTETGQTKTDQTKSSSPESNNNNNIIIFIITIAVIILAVAGVIIFKRTRSKK